MKVRFVRAWQTYRVGQIIEPPGVLRDWLRGNGYVEIVREEPEMETAMANPPAEHAALRVNPPKRGRGRPRKIPRALPA